MSILYNKDILDQGFVKVYNDGVYGNDLTIVNAARVSFGKRKEELDNSDIKLLNYLAKNKHYSPFRHVFVQFHIKAPETVLRQLYKHVVGIETTSANPTKDHAWNEISGRYVELTDIMSRSAGEFRQQSKDNKQASDGPIQDDITQKVLAMRRAQFIQAAINQYEFELEKGVSKEIAREVLPFATYTEVYWTASFQAIMNFIELRDHDHAQYEIRLYAKAIKDIVLEAFPESTKAWITSS